MSAFHSEFEKFAKSPSAEDREVEDFFCGPVSEEENQRGVEQRRFLSDNPGNPLEKDDNPLLPLLLSTSSVDKPPETYIPLAKESAEKKSTEPNLPACAKALQLKFERLNQKLEAEELRRADECLKKVPELTFSSRCPCIIRLENAMLANARAFGSYFPAKAFLDIWHPPYNFRKIQTRLLECELLDGQVLKGYYGGALVSERNAFDDCLAYIFALHPDYIIDRTFSRYYPNRSWRNFPGEWFKDSYKTVWQNECAAFEFLIYYIQHCMDNVS